MEKLSVSPLPKWQPLLSCCLDLALALFEEVASLWYNNIIVVAVVVVFATAAACAVTTAVAVVVVVVVIVVSIHCPAR